MPFAKMVGELLTEDKNYGYLHVNIVRSEKDTMVCVEYSRTPWLMFNMSFFCLSAPSPSTLSVK
jgi:hypothetical protein